MGEFIDVEVDDAVATIRMLRPKVSAVSPVVPMEMVAAARRVGQDSGIRAVILYGGKRVFGTGADVREMADRSHTEVADHALELLAAFSAIAMIPKPVIAAIAGYALGGGLELALCADLRVAGRSAVLGLPEIGLGIIPGTGGTQRLPRLVGPGHAKRLIYTGRPVDAERALAIGLLDEVVPDAEVYSTARELALELASGPAAALAAAKRAVDGGLDLSLDEGLEIERHEFARLFETDEPSIGIQAFLGRREPVFTPTTISSRKGP
jgi:enoyl-CoA hydratase/carnithine racemase